MRNNNDVPFDFDFNYGFIFDPDTEHFYSFSTQSQSTVLLWTEISTYFPELRMEEEMIAMTTGSSSKTDVVRSSWKEQTSLL